MSSKIWSCGIPDTIVRDEIVLEVIRDCGFTVNVTVILSDHGTPAYVTCTRGVSGLAGGLTNVEFSKADILSDLV